ncbi:MurT ligase domain-containing protein [Frisingicoccus caecimuris]|uniref:Lipid II isoglutaminyl synthase (glutamine-hydrolyzing) subunit MurT n=1 Tax=Frisingicoccus caecimuris TaxID=1796636 RepID=A0A4R2L7G9_9FIRM|nr:MurT ligase domain-containing protein [Frisingicoccus caecimuris]MCR1919804.1 MurT ligase domain-containing protein [Frisingicoccus caecimuris]TCO82565.1 UDP-N-acetylmuramyl tripeptide synthase [Frisingicoccus caecimuris]
MKKNTVRFYVTITIVKIATKILKLLGRNATHLPGWMANKLCPDFLGHLEKPERLVYITGTNGKTTVSNLTAEVLKDNGYDYINNASGSNVSEGVVSALLSKSSFFGKSRCKLAVLEVDERYSPLIYPYMPPDYLLCTNLFRDSYKRNAHTEFISGVLNSQIPKHTKLILNGEDLISNHLAMENERRYFGINCPDGHSSSDNIIKDIVACPNCGALLKYDYIRYNHIGRAHCPNCDFGSPELDYSVEKIDYENQRCLIKMPGGTCEFKLIGSNVTDIYNMLAAIALLSELGLEVSQIQKSFEIIKVVESRYYSENVHGKELVISLAKGQNPIACSRICDFIRHETGTKAVVCMMDDCYDAKESSENIAWIFDIDFEFLNDASVKQIVLTGVRNADYHLRLLMAGIPEEKIVLCDKEEDAASYVDYAAVDKIYILHDIYSVQYENAKKVYQDLKNRLEERGEEA